MASFSPPVQAAVAQTQPKPLGNDQKMQWNSFLDYMKQRGMQGSPLLDNRDTGLGQKLMEEYRSQNPHFSLTYDQVPAIQSDLQNYRQQLVQKYKTGKAVGTPDIKSENDIMAGLSPVDGWLGSKTSSYKYPTAILNNQSYGVNVPAYDAAMANLKRSK